MTVDQMRVGGEQIWTRTLDKYTMAGLPEICGQQYVRTTARDNAGRNTKDSHPFLGYKLKFLTPLEIEPGPPRRAGLEGRESYRPRHGDGPFQNYRTNRN